MNHLILTCAVKPDVSGPIAIRDVADRLQQYQHGYDRWATAIRADSWRPVLIETTGYGAENIVPAKIRGSTEYFDFTPTDTQRSNGKGAVEAAAMDAFIASLPATDRFLKTTGRLICKNAETMLLRVGPSTGQFDCSVRMNYRRPWMDTRLFVMNAGTWRSSFGSAARNVAESEGVFLEAVMGRLAMIALADGCPVVPLPIRPNWSGISGSSGKRYGGARQSLAARVLHPAERLLLAALDRKLL